MSPLILFWVLIVTVLGKPAIKYYASKYDYISVGEILDNKRMVNYYSACLLSKGPCPPEGVELKRILPEALHTNCARCSAKQAITALKAIKRLKKEYPEVWQQLSNKWDPDDVFVKRFETTFADRDISTIPNEITADRTEDPTDTIADTTIKITSSTTITSSTSSSTTKPPRVPGLIPLNTFFTNPPIPLRPINFNIGANIGATVKAIKNVEIMVANIALQKLGAIKRMFTPWRRLKPY